MAQSLELEVELDPGNQQFRTLQVEPGQPYTFYSHAYERLTKM